MTTERHHTLLDGTAVKLPSCVYETAGRLRVLVRVAGLQVPIGTFDTAERAIAERNRALALFSPWLRHLPDDVPPLPETETLPPNKPLNAALEKLRFFDPESERKGRVAPTRAEAKSTPKETQLDRIERKLDELLALSR